MPEARGPLTGLVVCDLSTVLAGPYCTMLLGDLGADVVKVEPPTGDPTRSYGPPFAGAPVPGESYPGADPRAHGDYPGESGYFLSVNRNKRGIRLDLRSVAGREVLRRLVARSDVLVENHRPGSLERSGFDDAELERIDPRLIHLSITGYGRSGPDAAKPGFDFITQAISGLMSITGAPDHDGGQPTKVGVAIVDLTTAMLGTVAILAALHERDRSGRGQRIDLDLLSSTISWLINQAANYLVGGGVPGRMGNLHPNITPYETFSTSDGQIAVAVGSERQWIRFCDALDLAQVAHDQRFTVNAERVRNRAVLRALLADRFASATTDQWLQRLADAEVPCGAVRDVAKVFADPQVLANGMLATVAHPTIGELRMTGIPFRLAGTPGAIRRPPPLLGEHTDEVLGELGYGHHEIASMHGDGVV